MGSSTQSLSYDSNVLFEIMPITKKLTRLEICPYNSPPLAIPEQKQNKNPMGRQSI